MMRTPNPISQGLEGLKDQHLFMLVVIHFFNSNPIVRLCQAQLKVPFSFHDISWHIPYDIKCHQLCQYGYQKNRLDQTYWSTGFKTIFQEQNLTQNPKNWNCNISFVFFRRFLYNFQSIYLWGGQTISKSKNLFSPGPYIWWSTKNQKNRKFGQILQFSQNPIQNPKKLKLQYFQIPDISR